MEQKTKKENVKSRYLPEEVIRNTKNNAENIMKVIEHFEPYIRRKSVIEINGRSQFSSYIYEEIRARAMYAAHKFEFRDE